MALGRSVMELNNYLASLSAVALAVEQGTTAPPSVEPLRLAHAGAVGLPHAQPHELVALRLACPRHHNPRPRLYVHQYYSRT